MTVHPLVELRLDRSDPWLFDESTSGLVMTQPFNPSTLQLGNLTYYKQVLAGFPEVSYSKRKSNRGWVTLYVQATDDECNDAQVAAVVGGLDYVLGAEGLRK